MTFFLLMTIMNICFVFFQSEKFQLTRELQIYKNENWISQDLPRDQVTQGEAKKLENKISKDSKIKIKKDELDPVYDLIVISDDNEPLAVPDNPTDDPNAESKADTIKDQSNEENDLLKLVKVKKDEQVAPGLLDICSSVISLKTTNSSIVDKAKNQLEPVSLNTVTRNQLFSSNQEVKYESKEVNDKSQVTGKKKLESPEKLEEGELSDASSKKLDKPLNNGVNFASIHTDLDDDTNEEFKGGAKTNEVIKKRKNLAIGTKRDMSSRPVKSSQTIAFQWLKKAKKVAPPAKPQVSDRQKSPCPVRLKTSTKSVSSERLYLPSPYSSDDDRSSSPRRESRSRSRSRPVRRSSRSPRRYNYRSDSEVSDEYHGRGRNIFRRSRAKYHSSSGSRSRSRSYSRSPSRRGRSRSGERISRRRRCYSSSCSSGSDCRSKARRTSPPKKKPYLVKMPHRINRKASPVKAKYQSRDKPDKSKLAEVYDSSISLNSASSSSSSDSDSDRDTGRKGRRRARARKRTRNSRSSSSSSEDCGKVERDDKKLADENSFSGNDRETGLRAKIKDLAVSNAMLITDLRYCRELLKRKVEEAKEAQENKPKDCKNCQELATSYAKQTIAVSELKVQLNEKKECKNCEELATSYAKQTIEVTELNAKLHAKSLELSNSMDRKCAQCQILTTSFYELNQIKLGLDEEVKDLKAKLNQMQFNVGPPEPCQGCHNLKICIARLQGELDKAGTANSTQKAELLGLTRSYNQLRSELKHTEDNGRGEDLSRCLRCEGHVVELETVKKQLKAMETKAKMADNLEKRVETLKASLIQAKEEVRMVNMDREDMYKQLTKKK